ncbi:MAG: CehA/McbA family metallohydrolase [Thermomicrobiales bacterium]|nr:CehA/McbA family metallohydrolase [Thermomicrobiales bacterium]
MSQETRPLAPPDIQLTGRFELDDVQVYRHVPFEVPAGVRQIHLDVAYNDRISSDKYLTGGNTLDVGLFDERGSQSGSLGFRGWSGSNKTAITVGETWSTPPYRSEPIGAGTWQVLLGPYKIGPNGLDYSVDIWFDPGIEKPEPNRSPILDLSVATVPPPIEAGWLRGDLHSHSTASDGDSTLLDMLQAARRAGLDFMGSTDHNAAMLPEAPDDPDLPLLIPGIEVTTYKGHWNVWGANRWFDFRLPDGEAVRSEMQIARNAGGFVSANHPKPFGPPWEYGFGLGYQGIEVWNGYWQSLNAISLAAWDAHLAAGQRVVAMAGSDTHFLRGEDQGALRRATIGHPTMWVKPDDPTSATSILDEIRAGRSFISASPTGPQMLIDHTGDRDVSIRTGGAAGLILALISSGTVISATAVDKDRWDQEFRVPASATHVRAQLMDGCGNVEALTNAVWLDG